MVVGRVAVIRHPTDFSPAVAPAHHRKLLIAKRAAGRMSQADAEALRLIDGNRDIRIDQMIRSIRLDVLQGREAMSQNDTALVNDKVSHARATLSRLPRDVDVAIYRQ